MDKEKLNRFVTHLKMFLWYMGTEPFRQLYTMFISIKIAFNKTVTWTYLTAFLMAYAIYKRDKLWLILSFLIFILFLIKWEWEDGNFIYRYRQYQKNKYIKKSFDNLKEENKNGNN